MTGLPHQAVGRISKVMSVSSSGWGRAFEKGWGRPASVRSSRFPGVRQSWPRGWGQALHRRSNPILQVTRWPHTTLPGAALL